MVLFKNCSQNLIPSKTLVAKGFFKNLLLWNHRSDFEIISQVWPFSKIVREILIRWKTWPSWGGFFHGVHFREILQNYSHLKLLVRFWQDCSLGDPFRKLFAKFWSIEKHGRPWGVGGDFLHYTDMGGGVGVYFCTIWTWSMKKFLKNLLLWNLWSEFGIISQDCSLCDPFRKLFIKVWSVKKHGRCGGKAFFIVWTSEKFFKILLIWNHLSDFGLISQDSSLGDSSKIVCEILILWKTWLPGGGGGGGGNMKNFLKNVLLWNPWSYFEIISQECSLGQPFKNLFAKFWSVHKHGSGELGLLALCGHEETHKKSLKKSSSLKPLIKFWNNFFGIFPWWPSSKLFMKVWSVNKHGSGEREHFALYRHEEI